MPKILLVHCVGFNKFTRGKDKFFYYAFPLGIGYLASYLRGKNYEVKLLELGLLAGWREFIEILKDYCPGIVGLSAMTPEAESAYQAAGVIKRVLPGAIVALGGPHATVCTIDALANTHIDYVVRGEGEITFSELCDSLRGSGDGSQVEGVVSRQTQGSKLHTVRAPIARLDDLPFPARDIAAAEDFHLRAYSLMFPMPYPYMNIMSSRGCLAHCKMCQPVLDTMFGKGMRFRGASNVIEEIKLLKKTHKIRGVVFWDDTFTLNRPWLDEFCDRLINERLNVAWWCYARVNTVQGHMLKKMKRAGCVMICFGVESGSQRILTEVLNKGTTVEHNRRAIFLCKKTGILANANVMLGSPTETLEEIKLTDQLLTETDPELIWASVTTPVPGTVLAQEAARDGLVLAQSWDEYSRGQSGKPKLKTRVDYQEIAYYQGKWHRVGFQWRFIREPHYLKLCLIRCLCHIRMGKFMRIYDDFLLISAQSLKQKLRKFPLMAKIADSIKKL